MKTMGEIVADAMKNDKPIDEKELKKAMINQAKDIAPNVDISVKVTNHKHDKNE